MMKQMRIVLLTLGALCVVACANNSKQPSIIDAIDVAVIIKATNDHELEYFGIKTEYYCKLDDAECYKSEYIGYDDFHTYYQYDYLTAVRNNEILQITEVLK